MGEERSPLENMGMSDAMWQDSPVLITGATGLLGGWLCKSLLEKGASLTSLVRDWVPASEFVHLSMPERVNVVRGDLGRPELLERVLGEYEIEVVFHLAAQTIVGIANRNPLSTFESNVRGTWNLLEACRRSPKVKAVLLASSDKAYGEQAALPYTEDMPLQGRHPYDVSKSCADLIAQSYATSFRVPVAITRCGNFYGGGDLNWNRVVPGTIRSIIRGDRPVIRSDGQYFRDYFYIEDGVAAYIMLAERLLQDASTAGRAFNFSNETQISVLDLVNKILRQMDCSLTPEIRNEVFHEIRHQYLSAELARKELHWSPKFTLEQGLERTIAWYREALK